MIDLAQLRKSDVGKWVKYRSSGSDKIERGRLKSWTDTFIFVVYKCNGEWERFGDFTGAATKPRDLVFEELEKEDNVWSRKRDG